MNIATLSARFEFYAQNNKSIKHNPSGKKKAFLLVDIQDVQTSVRNDLQFPCLLLQTPEVDKDGNFDGIVEHYEGSFVILDNCEGGQTAQFKTDLLDRCKKIADQVLKRMILDCDEFFESAQIKTSEGTFGPIAGGLFGWGVNYSFEQGFDGEVDAEDWEDMQ